MTHACNMKCLHCWYSAGTPFEGELKTNAWLNVIDQCSDFGMFYVTLNGGEPLMRSDIWEIIEYLEKTRLHWRLFTNGSLLNYEHIQKLADSDYLLTVQISLDGLTPNSYAGLRGVNCLEKVVDNIKKLVREGVPVEISSVVYCGNYDELPRIIEFAASLGVPLAIDNILPIGRGLDLWKEGKAIWLSDEERDRLNELAREVGLPTSIKSVKFGREHVSGIYCRGADAYIHVGPRGELVPCQFGLLPPFYKDFKVPNIRDMDLVDFWHSEFFEWFRNICDQPKRGEFCSACKFKESCMGCPCVSYLLFGELIGPSTECLRDYKRLGIPDEIVKKYLLKIFTVKH